MPRYKHSDGRVTYPNASASRRWRGCPMTCPDSCPYEECTMPPEIAESSQHATWHGWIVNSEGYTVMEGKMFGNKIGRRRKA